MTLGRLVRVVTTLFLFASASMASAATTEFRVFFDTDHDSTTGCTVGGMSGVEQVLSTVVADAPPSGSPAVTSTQRQLCTGGALGTAIDVDASGWPAAFDNATRELTFETRIRLSAFGPNGVPQDLRLGFETTRGSATHTSLLDGDGSDIIVPAPPVRRRAVGSPGAPRTIVLDGLLGDWDEIDSTVYGIASDGTQALRVLRVFSWFDPSGNPAEKYLYFAVIARLSSDMPYADDDLYTRRKGQNLAVSGPGVLQNDGDPFGQPLQAVKVTDPERGSVSLNGDGSFTYSPDHPQSMTGDEFEYKVKALDNRESNVARVEIRVTDVQVNEPPSFTAGGDVTVDEDSGLYSAPWATDISAGASEADQTVSFTVTNDFNSLFSQQPAISPAGTLTFVPAGDVNGSATVTVKLTDSEGASTSDITFTITVSPVNDAPTFVKGSNQAVPEDSPAQTVNPWATAISPGPSDEVGEGQTVSFSITGNTNPSLFSVAPAVSPTGVLTYTPAANANGTATITVTATDTGTPPASSSQQFTISLTAVNDNPSFTAGGDITVGEDSGAFSATWATAISAGPLEPSQTVSFTVTNNNNALFSVQPAIAPNGTLTFTPALNATGSATVSVTLFDNLGGSSAPAVTFTITVTVVDDPPVAVADSATVTEEAPATAVPVLTNDTDVDGGPISIASVTQPANGTVVITGGGTGLTYQPNANYCNTPPGTTLDTFTYTLTPGSSTTTVSMTVNCVDDSPTAVNDAATVVEDSGANAVNVLANDTDIDAGPISVTSVTQPANGTVVITGGGTGLTYAPNANYCNNPPGTTLDTFTYTLTPGGTSATVTMTVTCADDPPVAVADAATVNEDSGATAVNVLANDTDIDAGPMSVASVTQPANGTVVITGGGTGLTYAPNANYCNNPPGTTLDTFTYTLTPGSSSTTVTMTVTCLNDAPVIDLDADNSGGTSGSDYALTFTEGESAKLIEDPADATVTDVDNANLASLTVTLTNLLDTGFETLSADVTGTSIVANYVPATGVLTLTGPDTVANFQTVLRKVRYVNTDNAPNTTARVINFVANDGATNSNTAVSTVTVVEVDTPPTAVADSATVNEDSGATAVNVLTNDTDPDGGTISITSVTQPANGAVVITGGGTGLTYAPNANYCNNPPGTTLDTFTYTLTPGGSSTTVTMTVTCLNDAPVIDLDADNSGGTGGNDYAITFTEAEPAKLIEDAADATVTDVDNANLASLTVTLTNLLDITFETLSADVTGTSIVANYVPATGVLTLTGPDTVANFQTVLRTVRYLNTDNAPDTTARVINFVANDGATNGNTAVSTVTIVASDTPPTAVADSATVGEDAGATAVNVLTNDTDPDAGPISITSVTQPTNGAVVITGGGTGLTYAPNANYCNNPPGTTLDTFTYTLTPGGSSATVTMTVTCIDDAPVAVADAATVAEDSGATAVTVLANDTDVDGGAISITSVTQPTNGAVVITGGGTGLTYAPNANYCNNPPGTTLDTFTYTLTPGGSSTTVTMTVTCADDNPVAVADSATVGEDAGATAVNVLTNDTDVDGGPISITSVTQPTNGAVVITGGGTGLTYAPNANYCNTPPGTTLDTFTYTLTPGGSSTTVTMTVTCIDDNPVAVADSATVNEDSGANAVNVLTNDTDVDGGAISITSVTQPANGAVVITGGGTGLTYAPNANYCNNPPGTTLDTFTYTLTPGGSSTTVTMTVTCLNDAPAIDLDADNSGGTGGSDYAVTFTEGDSAKLIEDPADAVITDIDNASLASLTVTITNLLDPTFETLSADVTGTSIVANYVPGTGVLTLTGPDTLANFETVLRTVRYVNTDIAPDATARVVNFVANDGATNSNTAVSTVTVVPVDGPPTAVADSATVNEDSGATAVTVLANDTDPDGGPISITSVTQPANGAVVITGGGTGLTYAPNANYCNNPPGTTLDTFTYTLTPGGSSTTVTMTVTCIDDNPVAVADAATVVEDSGATAVTVLANDTDIDAGPISITSVTQPTNGAVVITGGGTGLTYAPNANYCNNPPGTTLDTFTYTLTPGGSSTTVTMTVTCVDDNPVAVADATTVVEDSGANAVDVLANDTDVDAGPKSVTSVTQPANGVVVITGGGTGLTYAPNVNYCNNPPGTTLDTFTYTLTPGSSSTTVTVTVTCVDDPPVAVADAATVVEDSGANAIPVLANDTDIDAGPISIASVTQPANGAVVITGGGTGLTYAPNLNYCNNPPGTTLDTFTYTLTPGSSSTTVTMTVTCVNDPPVADNDPFDFLGNTEFRVDSGASATPHTIETTGTTFGVIDGDSDPVEGDAIAVSAITVGACTDNVAPFDCTDAGVGRVQMLANGRFTFEPAAGDAGASETFQYTLTDNGTPSPASTTATVTLTRFERVWYIQQGGTGTGTSVAPLGSFTGIAGAGGAGDSDSTGDYIYVYSGSTITSSIELEAQQRLLGGGVALSIPVNLNGNGSPTNLVGVGALPTVTSSAAVGTVSATAAMPIEIRGLNLVSTGGGGNAIDVTTGAALSGSSSLTISDNTFGGASAEGIDVNLNVGTTGTVAIAMTTNAWLAGTHTGNAIDFDVNAGNLQLNLSNNTGIVSAASGIVIDGSTGGTTAITGFANNTITGNTGGTGISVTSATFDATPGSTFQVINAGTTTVGASGNGVGASGMVLTNVAGDLSFTDLDIFNDGGTGLGATGLAAYTGSAGFQIAVGAGVGTVTSIGGPAVSLNTVTASLPLTSISSTNSATTGVSLVTVPGTFSAGSGSSITNATGTDFNISGSNANVTYNGTITDDIGTLVSIANTTGGTKIFAGAITDGDDGDGSGVSLTTNAGTIRFNGGLVINTGPNPGFTATGGGTVEVCDEAGCDETLDGALINKITTTTATALNVTSTTIGVNGLEFEKISSTGGANAGIILSATGSSGTGLIVRGSAGSCTSAATCTGGAIQTKTVNGITINDSSDVSLNFMFIDNNDGSGIGGTLATDLSIANSRITNNADTNTGTESGIRFDTLAGTNSLTNTNVTGSFEDEIRITPSVGSNNFTLNITGGTFGPNGATTGNNLITLIGLNGASWTLNVSGATFTGSRGSAIMSNQNNTGKGTVSISASTFTDNGKGISIGSSQSADHDFDVDNNVSTTNAILGSNAQEFVSSSDATTSSTTRGVFNNNDIGDGSADSGAVNFYGIAVDIRNNADTTMAITNNFVRNSEYETVWVSSADFVPGDGGGAAFDLRMIGNIGGMPDDNGVAPIGAVYGMIVDTRHTTTMCASITGNDGTGRGGLEDLRLRVRDTAVFRLERLTDGDGTQGEILSTATTETHLNAENSGSSPTDASVFGGATGFTEATNNQCRSWPGL